MVRRMPREWLQRVMPVLQQMSRQPFCISWVLSRPRKSWAITVYDEFHFFNTVTNPLERYSIGTKDEDSLVYGPDGSLTLVVGAATPQQGTQNWLPAPDGEPFSLYIRAYWPDDVILSGQWQPPKIAQLPSGFERH